MSEYYDELEDDLDGFENIPWYGWLIGIPVIIIMAIVLGVIALVASTVNKLREWACSDDHGD